jgi:hypothetical protein
VTENAGWLRSWFVDAVASTALGESHDSEDVPATARTITIGVRPLTSLQTCLGIPGTPDLVRSAGPLGNEPCSMADVCSPGAGVTRGSGGSAGRRQVVRLWRGAGGGPQTRGTRRSP